MSLLIGDVLVELAWRDHDALEHVALPQYLARDLAPQLLAVIGVVDTVLREPGGQVLEG